MAGEPSKHGRRRPADAGATNAASIRYQALYAARLATLMTAGVGPIPGVEAVLCEEHSDDITLVLRGDRRIAIEVKAHSAPLSGTAASVLPALKRFARRQAESGAQYVQFHLATIYGFTRGGGPGDLELCTAQARELAPGAPPPTELAALVARIDREGDIGTARVVAMLAKLHLDAELPKRGYAMRHLQDAIRDLARDEAHTVAAAEAVYRLATEAGAAIADTAASDLASFAPDPDANRRAATSKARRLTSADVLAAIAAAEPPRSRASRVARRVAIATVVGVLGLAGFATGRQQQPGVHHVAAGPLMLPVAAPWHGAPASRAAAVTGLDLDHPVVAEDGRGAILVAGTATKTRGGRDPVPATLAATWRAPVEPRPVSGGHALSYRAALPDGTRQTIIMYALEHGWLILGCQARDAGALGSCESLAASAAPDEDRLRPVGPARAVAAMLDEVLEPVGKARARARAALNGTRLKDRAAAARDVAWEAARAADRIADFDVGAYAMASLRGARGALRDEARALRAVADAAELRDAREYRQAMSAAHTAERALGRRLARAGYPLLAPAAPITAG